MIDFIKINDLKKGVALQDLLDFEILSNENTGEVLLDRKKSAYYKNLVFTIIPGGKFVKMQGSLHCFANGGEKNNDRFTINRFQRISEELKNYVSEDDNINVIEFGINISTPFNPSDLIRNLLASGKKQFNRTMTQRICKAEANYNQYILKIYNKGLQQGPSDSNLLRIEVKYLKMENLFKNGLKWSDLNNPETWNYLGNVLLKKFSEVVYYDPSIKINDIDEQDANTLKEGHNPIYWQNLSGPHASRVRKRYQYLISKYGATFNTLEELILDEIKCLVNSDHLSRNNGNVEMVNSDHLSRNNGNVEMVNSDHLSRNTGKIEMVNSDHLSRNTGKIEMVNSDHLSGNTENMQMVNSDTLLYGHSSPQPSILIRCLVTGLDISMQKSTSRFLSTTGIRYYLDNDPEIFKKLRNRLTDTWANVPLDKQIIEIAHSIRNSHHSKRIHTQKAIRRLCTIPSLFNNLDLVCQEKKNIANQ